MPEPSTFHPSVPSTGLRSASHAGSRTTSRHLGHRQWASRSGRDAQASSCLRTRRRDRLDAPAHRGTDRRRGVSLRRCRSPRTRLPRRGGRQPRRATIGATTTPTLGSARKPRADDAGPTRRRSAVAARGGEAVRTRLTGRLRWSQSASSTPATCGGCTRTTLWRSDTPAGGRPLKRTVTPGARGVGA